MVTFVRPRAGYETSGFAPAATVFELQSLMPSVRVTASRKPSGLSSVYDISVA